MINRKNSSKGFTLAEFLVIVFILILIIRVVYSSYLLSRKSYLEGEKMAETTQNGRVILERMVREVRQSREIVTELSETESGATSTIEFEDGHISDFYYYIRYFKEGNEVKREVINYYFSGDPSTFVPWDASPPDASPPGGQTLETITHETTRTIGEHVSDLGFWGSETICIDITLERGGRILNLKTKVFGRNL